MKKILSLILILVLAASALAFTGCGKELHHVEIVVKDYGTIKLELDATTAPITVANFLQLAESGFYDGLTFHRIIEGFMIQGGDPNGNSTGGATQIKGEFAENGVENNIKHERGVISMARGGHPYYDFLFYDTGSCQFFIVHKDAPSLDGKYAAFGWVTDGMDVVDAIAENVPVIDDNGTVKFGHAPIIESIKVID